MTLKRASQARMLLRRSRIDADVLRLGVHDDVAAFHAQQAIEKALKAVLTVHRVDYPFTHSLPELAGMLADRGLELPLSPYRLGDFTECAVVLRYEESPEEIVFDRNKLIETTEIYLTWADGIVESIAQD